MPGIPKRNHRAMIARQANAPAPLQVEHLMKILVIDRVKLFQQIIAKVLEGTNIGYVFSHDGQTALQTLADGYFEIVCLSMHLDDMNAQELCKQIRKMERYAYTPILLLTSDESPELLQRALKAGMTDVFAKKDCEQLVNFITRFAHLGGQLTGRVLYVEDMLSQRMLMTEMFRRRGLEVEGFASGEKAWEAFCKHHYDLVITDIVLDGNMSGVTLANRIRRTNGYKGDTPILAITAFDNISRRISLFHLGIDDYVIKPVVEEELFARVKSLIESRRYQIDCTKAG